MAESGSSPKAETLTETATTAVAGGNDVDVATSAKAATEPVQLGSEATEGVGGEKLDKGESEAAAGKDSDRNPANGKKDKTKRPSDNATAAVKTPEAAIDAGTKETKEVEDSAATSSDKTAELTSSKHPSAEASAPAKSASRTSSSGLPPAPAPSGPKRTSSSDVGGQGKAKANAALEPSKQAAAAERADTAESTPDEALDESAPTVKALREQLSQNGTLALTGGTAQPATPAPRPEGPPQRRISEHDRINNTNALELLQSGAFKLVPGKDTVPYDKLITLRLEDGVDVTRKEEYLSPEEHTKVLGMDQAAFQKLPAWKRLQIKKSKLLF